MTPSAPAAPRLPLFSLARSSPYRTDPVALAAYYQNRGQLIRNLVFLGLGGLGWNISVAIITPLMALKLKDLGVTELVQGQIAMWNGFLVAFLVMLFGWMSDHTVSRFGRRKPYLYISGPIIVTMIGLFSPVAQMHQTGWLLAIYIAYLLAMDCKDSTFALISIDCIPRPVMARANAILSIVTGCLSFLLQRGAARLMETRGEDAPIFIGFLAMTGALVAYIFVREPPVRNPPTERFKPWSTFRIAAADKRIFLLMAGVGLLMVYIRVYGQWQWFWAKHDLNLEKANIMRALSWGSLIWMALAFPSAWIIDRVKRFKVVIAYFLMLTPCYLFIFHVTDKVGLIFLTFAHTIAGPFYQAADYMVYIEAPAEDIGAITSTNSCIRNLILAGAMGISGAIVSYGSGSHYKAAFTFGYVMAALAILCFALFQLTIRRGGPLRWYRDTSPRA